MEDTNFKHIIKKLRIIKTKSFRDLILRLIPFGNHETKMNVSERGKRALFLLYLASLDLLTKCAAVFTMTERDTVPGTGER